VIKRVGGEGGRGVDKVEKQRAVDVVLGDGQGRIG